MIILDTNIISALMRSHPDTAVARWLDAQVADELALTSITVFEIEFGILRLPTGRRRAQLHEQFARVMSDEFGARILPFDEPAARAAARVSAERAAAGRPIDVKDCQIAGIAISNDAAIATRNARDFAGLGIAVIDPWSPQAADPATQ